MRDVQRGDRAGEASFLGHLSVEGAPARLRAPGRSRPLPQGVRTRVVATEPLVLAIRHGDPLSNRKTITLAQLREQPMITLVRGSGLRTVLENACRDAGFVPRITAEAGELAALVELAAEGIGVAVLPRSATEGAKVAVVKVTRPRLERRTALAWKETATSPAGRAFLAVTNNASAPRRRCEPPPVPSRKATRCRARPHNERSESHAEARSLPLLGRTRVSELGPRDDRVGRASSVPTDDPLALAPQQLRERRRRRP